MSLSTPDRCSETIDSLERAHAVADRLADPDRQFSALYYLTAACDQRCDISRADRLIVELQNISERSGLPWQRFDTQAHVAGHLLLAGRVDEAEIANQDLLEQGLAAGSPDAYGHFSAILSNVRRHQGRLDEIIDFFLDVARDNPSIAALRAAIPMMLGELGRIDEARERLSVEADRDFDVPYDGTWLMSMARFLDAAVTIGDHTVARTLVDRVAPYDTQVIAAGGALVLGAIGRPLGRAATLLGDYQQAEEWFEIAHDIHTRLQAPFFTALGQLDHADLCLTRRAERDRERADDLATAAATTAAQYGCAGLSQRADALLTQI